MVQTEKQRLGRPPGRWRWYQKFVLLDDEDFDTQEHGLFQEMCDVTLAVVRGVNGYKKANIRVLPSHAVIFCGSVGNVVIHLRHGFRHQCGKDQWIWCHASTSNRGAVKAALKDDLRTREFYSAPVWVLGGLYVKPKKI